MINSPFLFYLPIIILAMICKYFLKKGGIILKMDGFLPRKTGNREKDSKWASTVSNIVVFGSIIFLIDMWIRFIQTEAAKIPALSGGE
ncbi:hypothetical protein SAMN05216326_1041 [Nitrosomonas marina]|uniref:Uncharacterized protein n=1 Tax=Nitrosomonas marina TaxID=917 RepID=A0A1H9ZD65_9PROT|nr:hypothetical protein [Nitrosomonas marina]SES79502.1 hypothetical protein SAMN05216326_1041 [Nitrosomonas marina]